MKTITAKIVGSVLIVAATMAAIALSYRGHAAEVEPVPRKVTTENSPAIDWRSIDDSHAGRRALTLDYAKGVSPDPISMTVYDSDGGVLATLYPDGTVKVQKGTPAEAARVFYAIITKQLRTCNKIP